MPRTFGGERPRQCDECGTVFTPKPGGGHARYCPPCRPRVKARTRRRYDTPFHRSLRARLRALVDVGQGECVTCGKHIPPGAPFDLGHVPGGGPYDYLGMQCVPCNRATNTGTKSHTRTSVTLDFVDGEPTLVECDDDDPLRIY